MSDEEEESMSEGFSASEDEWKPSKDVRDGESSDDDDSEFEESRLPATASNNSSGTASGANRKREPKSKTATKQVAIKKRKPAGQSLRTKLYNKYRPPPKVFPSPSSAGSNSPSASTSRTASKNAKAPNESGEHSNDSSSDSSVEDYLVNPAELDLQSNFFKVGGAKVAEKSPSPAPIFDCNAGIANLSDSGSEDNNESSADEHAKANAFDFGNLLENVNSLERAKETIAKRAAVAKAQSKTSATQHADTTAMDVNSLLALGEKQSHAKADKKKDGREVEGEEPAVLEHADHELGPQKLSKTKSTRVKRHTKTRPTSTVVAGDTDDSDWEEVSDDTHNRSAHEHSALNASGHNENLEIHVELPSRHRAKEKKQQDLELAFRRKVNRNLKERQLQLHKTSLLCHFARSYFCNRLLNDTALMQAALKLLPSQNAYPPERGTEIKYYQSLVTWYKTAIKLSSPNLYPDNATSKKRRIKPALLAQIKRKEACCKQDMVFIFVALLRGMGLQCRLVFNLQPLPLKPQQSDLLKITLKRDGEKKDEVVAKKPKVEGEDKKEKSKTVVKGSPSAEKSGKRESKERQLEKKGSRNEKDVNVKKVKEKEEVLNAKSQKKTAKSETHSLSQKVADKEKSLKKKLDKKDTTGDDQVDKKYSESSAAKIVPKSKDVLKKVADKIEVEGTSKAKVESVVKKANHNEELVNFANEELKENKKTVGSKNTAQSHKPTENATKYTVNRHDNRSKELSKTVSATNSTHAIAEHSSIKSKSASMQPALSKLRLKQPSVEKSITHTEKDDAEDDRPSISVGFTPIARRTRQATTNVGTKNTSVAASSNKPVIEVGSPVIPKIIIHGGKIDSSNTSKASEIENKSTVQTRITRSRSSSPKLQISPSFLQTENYKKQFLNDIPPAFTKPKRAASKSPTNKVKISTDFLQHPAGKNSEIVATRVLRSRQKSNEVANDAKSAGTVIPQLDGADDIAFDSGKSKSKRPQLKKLQKSRSRSQEDSDEDFEPSPPKQTKKAPQIPPQKSVTDRRVLSTDEENTSGEGSTKRKPTAGDIWVEVWSDLEEQWVCIDLFKAKIHSIESIRKAATSSFAYVFAFQNDLSVKDVTARYCPNWTSTVRKSRVERTWLETAISNYYGLRTPRDIKEDQELRRIHEEKPLPTAISEYKDHPLYALERHLLKFQAIYPPNAPTLGFIRGEPVYSRDCVHTLHSRDIWLKQARTVKLGEQPYKIVKARPKWDRLTQTVIKDQPLEIFGYWQTQDYEPPTAENGIVPRNAYGNVELFKECMLPKKTVHLKLPGLNRICKKLGIDCANAVIGFDFHQGACHPLYDGFVVCEEFADQVTAAWYQDQEEQDRKEQEKYEARVYGNWKKLIKGLLIRERLKKKYNF